MNARTKKKISCFFQILDKNSYKINVFVKSAYVELIWLLQHVKTTRKSISYEPGRSASLGSRARRRLIRPPPPPPAPPITQPPQTLENAERIAPPTRQTAATDVSFFSKCLRLQFGASEVRSVRRFPLFVLSVSPKTFKNK